AAAFDGARSEGRCVSEHAQQKAAASANVAAAGPEERTFAARGAAAFGASLAGNAGHVVPAAGAAAAGAGAGVEEGEVQSQQGGQTQQAGDGPEEVGPPGHRPHVREGTPWIAGGSGNFEPATGEPPPASRTRPSPPPAAGEEAEAHKLWCEGRG